ncbi:unnamed protein product [Protopolystoma xenopodis]|uniref:Uncharacterized protein n=1 Tax=Protopolystoma xenopodis TaxID=117903 RepID=A0A448WMX1_9PLAT|nr:unnamed protein product [Protopolystoma xenopodis]
MAIPLKYLIRIPTSEERTGGNASSKVRGRKQQRGRCQDGPELSASRARGSAQLGTRSGTVQLGIDDDKSGVRTNGADGNEEDEDEDEITGSETNDLEHQISSDQLGCSLKAACYHPLLLACEYGCCGQQVTSSTLDEIEANRPVQNDSQSPHSIARILQIRKETYAMERNRILMAQDYQRLAVKRWRLNMAPHPGELIW